MGLESLNKGFSRQGGAAKDDTGLTFATGPAFGIRVNQKTQTAHFPSLSTLRREFTPLRRTHTSLPPLLKWTVWRFAGFGFREHHILPVGSISNQLADGLTPPNSFVTGSRTRSDHAARRLLLARQHPGEMLLNIHWFADIDEVAVS